jgi:hypothetical protein
LTRTQTVGTLACTCYHSAVSVHTAEGARALLCTCGGEAEALSSTRAQLAVNRICSHHYSCNDDIGLHGLQDVDLGLVRVHLIVGRSRGHRRTACLCASAVANCSASLAKTTLRGQAHGVLQLSMLRADHMNYHHRPNQHLPGHTYAVFAIVGPSSCLAITLFSFS